MQLGSDRFVLALSCLEEGDGEEEAQEEEQEEEEGLELRDGQESVRV